MPRQRAVDAWFAKYDNPMKAVVMRIRDVVLAADPRIDECIKWQAPTFTFRGNLASFYPKSKQHASLMFHNGAQIPGTHPRLEGSGDVSRVLKLASLDEVEAARSDLEAIVAAWCAWKSEGGNSAAAAKRTTVARRTAKAPAKRTPAKPTRAKQPARRTASTGRR
jgi:uncharacterized protein YdhG (YjbR/CyaY superfamily)